ncbi:PR5-like receptor kinase [Cardamine amara subsp. amara]|uniref:PR5-like receptor kinase n=1 Tax=Cardamine amara subsp. amara TaxID=228776 RepID=A0ABD1BYK7_CARAN
MVEGLPFMFILVSHLLVSGVTSRNFTIENKCDYNVWPAGFSTSSTVPLSTTGFLLKKGESRVINAPSSWSGRFWGRSLCSINSTGSFSCATGDCGSGKVECSGAAGKLPVTLAEFALDTFNGQDFYDLSVVDGYNLPLVVVPQRSQSGRTCSSVSCVVNLDETCPPELKVGGDQPVACMSACQKFNLPIFCCTNTTEKCQPTLYSRNFKNECPLAYSYPLDDATSTFTCSNSPNYVITFCPPITPNMTNNNRSSVADSPFEAPTKNGTLEPPSESQPSGSKETNGGTKRQKSSWKLKLILGVLAVLTVMIIIVVAIIVRIRHASDWNDKNVEAVVMLKRYSYTSVKKMTNSFVHVLGKGGFGTVYKGKLPDSAQDVAVKILKELEGNGDEFINEVASMSRTSHVNIVSLLGFCYERNKRAIIYEFMPNGSLDKFIAENMPTKMEWERLYEIAVGVSRGLEYLHNRCVSRIVHFDIKPQNILMDENFCPKISDFGLAKLCKNKESIVSMLEARGTAGYIAPEVVYKSYGGASHKSDVYSYGMVVLEMIGARNIEKIQNARSNNSSVYFPDWIYKDFERGEIMRIFGDQITEEEERIAKKLVLVGLWCIQTNPSDRPPMIKVIEMLEGNLEDIQVPPKPLLYLPATTVPETLEDSNETSSFSNPSQFERGHPKVKSTCERIS